MLVSLFHPFERLRPQPDLYQGLQELGLGLAYLGGVHQREDFALLYPVACLLVDAEHGTGHAGRQTGRAGLVIGDLAVSCDRLHHRRLPDRLDLDASLFEVLLGGELDAAEVESTLGIVLRPFREFQRPRHPRQIGR